MPRDLRTHCVGAGARGEVNEADSFVGHELGQEGGEIRSEEDENGEDVAEGRRDAGQLHGVLRCVVSVVSANFRKG